MKSFFLLILAGVIIIIFILLYPMIEVARITIDGAEYLATPNTRVVITLEYKHSVELARIVEEYEVIDCRIKLEKFIWPGYGAGLSSKPDEIPDHAVERSGSFMIEDIMLNVTMLKISMKYRIDSKLLVNGVEIESREEVMIIACTRISLLEFLKGHVL
ncbi:MAG: DUF1850 domain-containing protein [Sulfolobales archaeon]